MNMLERPEGDEDDQLDPRKAEAGISTSSVGPAVYPPVEASFGRLKGVDTTHIDTVELLRDRLNYIRNLDLSETWSRVTLRVFVDNSLINIIQKEYPEIFEGIIDLSGCGIDALEKSSIIYLGKNHESRMPDQELLDFQVEQAKRIFEEEPSPEKNMSRFTVRELDETDKTNPEILQMYFELVETFGWSLDDVNDLLVNPNNRIIACFTIEDGKTIMAGAGIAELFEFPIQLSGGQKVTLSGAEMTEATTDPKYQGAGIYRAISNMELEILARKGFHLAFAESCLASRSVLQVGLNQGRKLGLLLPSTGLRNHVTVGGRLQNFVPTYITQRKLLARLERY